MLARMEADGWVRVHRRAAAGQPGQEGVRRLAAPASDVLAAWLAEPTPDPPLRSDLAVKLRGASFGDRQAVLDVVRANLADHHVRLDHYRQLMKRDYPEPSALAGLDLDQYLVLRGGILHGGDLDRVAHRIPARHEPHQSKHHQ